MQAKTHYEVFGLSKGEVDLNLLKVTHRKYSTLFHPDAPGYTATLDDGILSKVNLAWATLKNPVNKNLYDQEIENNENPIEIDAILNIENILNDIITNRLEQAIQPHLSIKISITESISRTRTDVNGQIATTQTIIAKLEKIKKRFTVKKDSALIITKIDAEINKHKSILAESEKHIKILDRMTEMMDDYEYEFTEPAASSIAWQTSNFTNFTNF